MAPRMYRNDSGRQAPRTVRPSHPSSNMQSRVVQSSRRSARMSTTTQLEGFAPNAAPRAHQSPTSRGNIRLLAAIGNRDSRSGLGRLRSAIEGLEDGRMNQDRFIPPESDSTEPLELPEIDADTSPEEVENMVQHMIDYLLKWTDVKHVEGSATVFQDIRLIHASLQNIMELPEEVISSPMVRNALRTFRKRYETFVTIWARAIHRALIGKLSQVESQAKRHPTTFPESRFTSLVSEIRTVSSEYALLLLLDSAHDKIKLLVPPVAAKELLDRCAHLHQVFQNAAYNSEQKELWLLIWRALKTAFTAFEQGGAPKSPTNVERDRKFFEIPGVYREFQRLISSPDAANPRSIEDMVGKYCRYIGECQIDPGNKYESLQRPRDAPLESHTKEALKEFIQTGKFETSTLSKIHFAVARFNQITGGPVKVRRWQHDVGDTEWEIVALDLPSPASTHIVERRPSYSDFPSSARSQSTFVELDKRKSLEDAGQESSKHLFPYPKGVNMKSAFDYVYYPFPETRAHELVQHEQISREMGQPGMISEGPRAEYLINRPPRHARDPADLSISKRTLGPLEWIRLVIHQVLPQRRRVPDAKHPQVSVLPSRRSKKLSLLKPRPLPTDPKARVYKVPTVTPDLKLRGGGPQSSRPGASSKRKRHFNPLAFRQMMVENLQREIIRRELESGRGGLSKYLPDDSMLYLLEQTTYDVQKAVHLWQVSMGYRGIGLAGNTTKEPHHYLCAGEMVSSQAASKMSLLFGGIPVDNNAEIYAYRLDSLAPSATSPVVAHSPHDDDSDDDPNQGHGQTLPRPALGELPVDVGVYDENGGEHSSQHSSNRENHSPRPPQFPQPPQPPHNSPTPEPILSQCHPCPMYESQYHHVCRCIHVVYPAPPPPDDFRGSYNSAGRSNRGSSPQPTNNESEDPVDEGNNAPVGGAPSAASRRDRRPPREAPRYDDEQYVREVFAGDQGHENALREVGNGNLATVVRSILFGGLEWTVDHESRAGLMITIDNLAEEIRKLKDRYLELLEGPKPFMEGLNDSRTPNPDVPATIDICQRAAVEVRNHHARLLQFFNYEHPRTHLGFRHQYNRFIRALRELRQLVEEYDHENPLGNNGREHRQQDQGSRTRDERVNHEEGSDDTRSDSETTLSPREKTRLANHPTSPKRYKALALPTRGEYELMFVDELERELQKNRGVKDLEDVLGKKYKKADLIDKLMALDGEGSLGRGATECYRHITGNPTSRSRPKRFNLEKALTQYYSNRNNERILAQRARKDARRQARIGQGIHSPAPVMPRVHPSQVLFTQPTGAIDADTQTTWSQDSEESDTWSEDIANP